MTQPKATDDGPDVRRVKPRNGARVRLPFGPGALLDAGGEDVTWSSYWQRRLDDGEITAAPVSPEPAPKKNEER